MKAKLPVFSTLGRAFVAVFSTRILLSGWFIKCFLAYFVVIQLHAYIYRAAIDLHASIYGLIYGLTVLTYEYYFIFSTLTALPLYFIMAPFFIAIHRLIILGDDLPSKPFKNFFSKRNVNFMLYWFLLISPLVIIDVISELGEKFGFPESIDILFVLLPILGGLIYVRVIICLPFIAIDNRQTLSRCWDITKGSTWRFFAAWFIVLVIITLINEFVMVPLSELALGLWPELYGRLFAWLRWYVSQFSIALINHFVLFVFTAWFVAIVSYAFNFFREEKGFDILEEKG